MASNVHLAEELLQCFDQRSLAAGLNRALTQRRGPRQKPIGTFRAQLRLLHNGEDLAPVQDMDGEFVSALELIPGPDIQPDEALLRKESTIQFYELKQRFEAILADRRLINLVELGCNGVSKPKALAAHLKLGVRTIYNLRARLQRAWLRFVGGPRATMRHYKLPSRSKRCAPAKEASPERNGVRTKYCVARRSGGGRCAFFALIHPILKGCPKIARRLQSRVTCRAPN